MSSDNSARIIACAIAPNLDDFEQVIEQMQDVFGENWGGLNLEDALPVLNSRHADQMDHVVIALSKADTLDVDNLLQIITAAKQRNIKVTIVTEQINPSILQSLMRSDADEFLPHPLPKGGLRTNFEKLGASLVSNIPQPTQQPVPEQAQKPVPNPVEQVEEPAPIAPAPAAVAAPAVEIPQGVAPQMVPQDPQPVAPAPQAAEQTAPVAAPATPVQEVPQAAPAQITQPVQFDGAQKNGIILPVYGMAGGVGASTFAANLAWEIQTIISKTNGTVCLLDFGFQFGSIATYMDVGRSDVGLEFLSNTTLDAQAFSQAIPKYKGKLDVLPAPVDAVPLEVADPAEIAALLDLAASMYDYVIVDLPTALVSWSEAVLQRAKLYLAVGEVEMRSAQNALRFLRVLKADDLPYEKVQFIINRAPKKTDLNGRSRLKRMSDSLNVEFRWQLPDGGKQVLTSCDQGAPLAETAARNPLRKEIRKIADNIVQLGANEEPAKAKRA